MKGETTMSNKVAKRNGVTIVKPDGKLIGTAVTELRDTILREMQPERGGNPRLLFDLSHVSMMDSSALGMLMDAYKSLLKWGGRVGVIHISINIDNLMVRSRLVGTFEHFDSENEAVKSLAL